MKSFSSEYNTHTHTHTSLYNPHHPIPTARVLIPTAWVLIPTARVLIPTAWILYPQCGYHTHSVGTNPQLGYLTHSVTVIAVVVAMKQPAKTVEITV